MNWALLSSFLVAVLTSLAKAWFAQQAAEQDAEMQGADKAETNAIAIANQAAAVRASVKPLAVKDLQSHTPASDPDFRD